MSELRTQSLGEVKNEFDPEDEIVHLRAENKKLRAGLNRQKREAGSMKSIARELSDEIEDMPTPPLLYKLPKKIKVSAPCVPVIHLTDWHIGAIQEPDEIECINEYNMEIAERRLSDLMSDYLKWVEVHRSNYLMDEVLIIITGDLISGDIHEELKITNAFPSPRQTVEASRLVAECISIISSHFTKTRVEFLTADNHSRLTRKNQMKQGGINSFNYIVGHFAKERIKNNERVTFNIHEKIYATIGVSNRRYLLAHGHTFSGGGGVSGMPAYSIFRLMGKEALSRMNLPSTTHFNMVIIGHFHTPSIFQMVMVGGSLSGTDAYDHANARHSEAAQTAWIVHPEHGEFDWTSFKLR